jgi:hypothetical protein
MLPKSSASPVAGQPTTNLQLERLPNGELAWLQPDRAPATRKYVLPSRYIVTDQARRELAMLALFGPCPTVAEVARQERDRHA